jgi:uncharacterized membrane protein YhdT
MVDERIGNMKRHNILWLSFLSTVVYFLLWLLVSELFGGSIGTTFTLLAGMCIIAAPILFIWAIVATVKHKTPPKKITVQRLSDDFLRSTDAYKNIRNTFFDD